MSISKEELQREQISKRFLSFDQEKILSIFPLTHDEETITVDFLGKTYTIRRNEGQMYLGNELASIDETASVFELLTNSEHLPVVTGKWESIASLCTNTTDTSLTRYIEYLQPFNEDTAKMQDALLRLGGNPQNKGDASAILEVFKNVPVWVQYWASDDEFPASIQFLFDAGIVEHFRWSLLWNVMTCITDRMLEVEGLHR